MTKHDDEVARTSVFIDSTVLNTEYIPPILQHRMENLQYLSELFQPIYSKNPTSQKSIITGPEGSGKTAIAKELCRLTQLKADEDNLNIKCVRIICSYSTKHLIRKIADKFNLFYQSPQISLDDIITKIFNHLKYKNLTLLLILDGIDKTVKSDGTQFLDLILNHPDHTHRISFILVCLSTDFLSAFSPEIIDSFSKSIIKLEPYTQDQITEILTNRVKLAFVENVITQETIQFISETNLIPGNIKTALELLWHAGRIADEEKSPIILRDHIKTGIARVKHLLERQGYFSPR